MIGSNELTVTGITADGDRVPVLRGRPLADLERLPFSAAPGEVPERLNGHDWKSCDGVNLVRGFESLPLRSTPVARNRVRMSAGA